MVATEEALTIPEKVDNQPFSGTSSTVLAQKLRRLTQLRHAARQ
jgi:hypothetical protein